MAKHNPFSSVIGALLQTIMFSNTSAMTLTAALGQHTWSNATSVPAASPFESSNVRARPVATMSTLHVPLTSKPAKRVAISDNETTITEIATVTLGSMSSLTASKSCQDDYELPSTRSQNAAAFMSEIAVGLESFISAQLTEQATIKPSTPNVSIDAADSKPSATTQSIVTTASMAVLNLASGSIIFLNTTTANYVFVDHANSSVFIWTTPNNDSTSPSDSHWKRFVNQTIALLPVVEVLGAATALLKGGRWCKDKVLQRRGRRAQASDA